MIKVLVWKVIRNLFFVVVVLVFFWLTLLNKNQSQMSREDYKSLTFLILVFPLTIF